MNIIIFSKDRGCQLELFLRSMEKEFSQFDSEIIKILYTYSNDSFKEGYMKTQQTFSDKKNLLWIKESNFKEDLLKCVDIDNRFTVFFTDDNIWINPFSLKNDRFVNFERCDDICCFSLRLNPYISYSYVNNRPITKRPVFDKYGVFSHIGMGSYYEYTMSVDGHIFRTNDILPLMKKLTYNNPNSFEANLSKNQIPKTKMCCLEKSVIVNNPINMVQTVYKNRNEGGNAEEINRKYISGLRLSLDGISGINPKCPHQPIILSFRKFVSVVIPTFDRYDWLMHSIESVNKQTRGDFEILVINDMSSDKRYDETDWKKLNVRYFKTEENNFGSCGARNVGLKNARFEWIGMLDDDDSWLPDKLKIQMTQLGDYLISSTNGYYCLTPPPYSGKSFPKYFETMSNVITLKSEVEGNCLVNSSVIVNKKLALEAGGFTRDNEIKCTDWPMWIKCMQHNDCKYIDVPLFYYNDSPRDRHARIRGLDK